MTEATLITLKKIDYKGTPRLGVFFKYNNALIDQVKNIPGRLFSKTLKCWHLPYTNDSYDHVKKLKGNLSISKVLDFNQSHNSEHGPKAISQDWLNKVMDFEKYLKTQRYSSNTIDSYLNAIKLMLGWMHETEHD